MRERALSFGPDSGLVGILTQADPDRTAAEAPAHIILNSGILHRAGASRLHVQLARTLAEEGITTFRFDFSGIGDSEVRRDSLPIEERFLVETREAMDYVQTVSRASSFVLGGLCSGADAAFWAALRDERVVGVWQIDGFCYKTLEYYVRRYGPKLLKPSAWLNSIKARRPFADSDEQSDVFVAPEYRRVFPPRSEVGRGLKMLLDRDVSLWFFFTGGLEEYNYSDQHADAFRELDLESRAFIRFEPECSHTVTSLEHQRVLIEDVRAWYRELIPLAERVGR